VRLKLPLLVLWAIAPILLLRLAQLYFGWGIHHVVLGRSTPRPTTSKGSSHDPFPLLLFGLNYGLHCPPLVCGGTREVIAGQVAGLDQMILQLDGKPITEEDGFLLIHVDVVGPILGKGIELLCRTWCGSLVLDQGTHSAWSGVDPQIDDVHGRRCKPCPMEHDDPRVVQWCRRSTRLHLSLKVVALRIEFSKTLYSGVA
jgi:hypothetical protein